MNWRDLLEGYHFNMTAAGRSAGTIRLHRYRIWALAERVSDPRKVTTDDLVRMLAEPGWKPETRKSVRTSLRSFFRWAHEAGLLESDPSARLPSVRVPPAVPRPAPDDVVRQALRTAGPEASLMVKLAAFGGLRAAEVARVHGRDVVGDVLFVRGKGGRTRAVPLVPELVEALAGIEGWAFPNRWTGEPVTAGHVTKTVSAALPEGWTCHTLRHRMASAAYAGSRDLLAVGALLGHSRPETTQRYVRLPDDALRAAVAHVGLS